MSASVRLSRQIRFRVECAALATALTLALGGCDRPSLNDVTGSIGASDDTPPQEAGALRLYTQQWGRRYDASPADRRAAINYAKGLRAQTQYSQAVAVLETAAVKAPNDIELLGAYGKALADAGRLNEAADVLARAHTPERPNWRILTAQGSVADQMGDHASAQSFYETALKIAPGEPSTLSNLGLSYALSKRLPEAESTLRAAAASPRSDARVRQNLALVLALEGKFDEARTVAERDLSPADAAANVAAIRSMIAQSNAWRDIQAGARPRSAAR